MILALNYVRPLRHKTLVHRLRRWRSNSSVKLGQPLLIFRHRRVALFLQ
jgi:hypothetical protein